MVLKSSQYKLDEKSEFKSLQHKEAISMLKIDSPEIIDDVGLKHKLLKGEHKEEEKLIK